MILCRKDLESKEVQKEILRMVRTLVEMKTNRDYPYGDKVNIGFKVRKL